MMAKADLEALEETIAILGDRLRGKAWPRHATNVKRPRKALAGLITHVCHMGSTQ